MFGTYCRLGVHVGASQLDVLRAVRARLKRPLPLDPAGKARRKAIYKAMLREHRDALALYRAVNG